MYLDLRNGKKVHYDEAYSRNGVHIDILDECTPEEKEEIRKTLNSERDLLSLNFKKVGYCKQCMATPCQQQ